MTEQQRPDEEVEGHGSRPKLEDEAPDEDVEGHARAMLDDEDVEGHARAMLDDEASDDVAGHGWTHKQDDQG